jgi:hypothetical protein
MTQPKPPTHYPHDDAGHGRGTLSPEILANLSFGDHDHAYYDHA